MRYAVGEVAAADALKPKGVGERMGEARLDAFDDCGLLAHHAPEAFGDFGIRDVGLEAEPGERALKGATTTFRLGERPIREVEARGEDVERIAADDAVAAAFALLRRARQPAGQPAKSSAAPE